MEGKPLGLMPRNVWERGRKIELLNAMGRYVEASVPIPSEWVEELAALNIGQSQQSNLRYKTVYPAILEALGTKCGSESQDGEQEYLSGLLNKKVSMLHGHDKKPWDSGVVLAVCDAPSALVLKPDGEKAWWRVDLLELED